MIVLRTQKLKKKFLCALKKNLKNGFHRISTTNYEHEVQLLGIILDKGLKW